MGGLSTVLPTFFSTPFINVSYRYSIKSINFITFDISLLVKEFGKEVAEIVDGVTKISGIFKGHDITKAENYRKMLLSMVRDVRVIIVKFADRLHNMRTLEFVPPDKQRRIAQETLEIYAPFANRFGLARVKWELEDLSFKYLNITLKKYQHVH